MGFSDGHGIVEQMVKVHPVGIAEIAVAQSVVPHALLLYLILNDAFKFGAEFRIRLVLEPADASANQTISGDHCVRRYDERAQRIPVGPSRQVN